MNQFKITTADFITPGETGEQDAYLDPASLDELRRLSGISGLMNSAIARVSNAALIHVATTQLREVTHETTVRSPLFG
jgi:hypothetical protein